MLDKSFEQAIFVCMQKILLSDDLYQRLLHKATSFEDSPETVISRLLDESGEADSGRLHPSAAPVPPGSVLPVRQYWLPILEVLDEHGGSAPSTEVIDALEERMQDAFTPKDLLRLQSGEIRWRNRARFARLRMKEQGLLSAASHRGIWAMTDEGAEYLARARSSQND